MKRFVIFLMSGFAVFTCCKNDLENPTPVYSNEIVLPQTKTSAVTDTNHLGCGGGSLPTTTSSQTDTGSPVTNQSQTPNPNPTLPPLPTPPLPPPGGPVVVQFPGGPQPGTGPDPFPGTTNCVEARINSFSKDPFICTDAKVDELSFQGKTIYIFNFGTCAIDGASNVIDSDCAYLGTLGGLTGNTKINGEEILNAVFIRNMWMK
jgi:hypothetical protein